MESIRHKCTATFSKVIVAGLILFSGGFPIWQADASDGTLQSWGYNYSGQLGLGDNTNRWSPVQVGTITDWVKIDTGFSSTFAIKTNGTLWSWGGNSHGQLGLGYTNVYPSHGPYSPTQVGTATWTSVAQNFYPVSTTVAVRSDGTLWSWGFGGSGLLGRGFTDYLAHPSPTQVGTATNWASVAGGYQHMMAIKTDGTLWTWGNNAYGQLGLGDNAQRLSPTQVLPGTQWSSVSGGRYHTVAVRSDGTVWSWGGYEFGALGLGTAAININIPTQVGTDTNWASVSVRSSESTMALKTNGTLWSWGVNNRGNLGLGDTVIRYYPTQVGTDTDWANVSSGNFPYWFTLATKTNGTLWAWGNNDFGQLGLGYTSVHPAHGPYSPTRVGTGTNWGAVSAGSYYSMAIGVTTGVCGTNSNGGVAYAADAVAPANWTSGFCSTGVASATPAFPSAGAAVTWNCNATPCTAQRDAVCVPACDNDANICIGKTYSDGCSGTCNGAKDCRDLNWREVAPN